MGVVGVAFFVRVRVVNAVRRHPGYWTALKRERANKGSRIFERLPEFETAMGQRAVIAQRNADGPGQIPKHEHHYDRRPREKARPECSQRAEVDDKQTGPDTPPYLLALGDHRSVCHLF